MRIESMILSRVLPWHSLPITRMRVRGGYPYDIVDLTLNTRETAARIVFLDDIFRAMTRQVQYMAIHCTPKMNELNLCTNT